MRILFLALAFFATALLSAQTGDFPVVKTEMVSGETITIPSHFKDSFVLIGVGTSKKAESELRTWQNPVYNKFIAKTGLMDELYDVEVCFLPLFTGAAKSAKGKVIKDLKKSNESLVIDNLYIYSGSRDPFKSLGVKERDTPYFYLLDKTGQIVWLAEGAFKQKYLDEIEEILTQ